MVLKFGQLQRSTISTTLLHVRICGSWEMSCPILGSRNCIFHRRKKAGPCPIKHPDQLCIPVGWRNYMKEDARKPQACLEMKLRDFLMFIEMTSPGEEELKK